MKGAKPTARRTSHGGIWQAAIAAAVLALAACCSLAHAKPASGSGATLLYNLKGEVNLDTILKDTETTMGLGIAKARNSDTRGIVTDVKLGSAAARRGIRVGDTILDEKIRGNWLELTVQRQGKSYQATLSEYGLEALQPRSAPTGKSPELQRLIAKIQALDARHHKMTNIKQVDELTKKQVLAAHDVVIMIDKSGSMSTHDCPHGTSRWQWCADQSFTFSKQYDEAAKRDLTVVLFDGEVHTYDHIRFSDINRLFQENKPSGGTNTADALDQQVRKLFGHRAGRPLVVAIITDGMPTNFEALRQEIIDASRHERFPNELIIDFLHVGNDPISAAYLDDLDNGLVSAGAGADIVDVQSFSTLQDLGLRDAILQAIISTAASPVPGSNKAPINRGGSYSSGAARR